jgi:hypothetical protein
MNKIMLVLLLASVPALADCPAGTIEVEGVCAADLKPQQPTQADGIEPSTEVAPRHEQPEWESGAVHADMGVHPSTEPVEHNYKAEEEEK